LPSCPWRKNKPRRITARRRQQVELLHAGPLDFKGYNPSLSYLPYTLSLPKCARYILLGVKFRLLKCFISAHFIFIHDWWETIRGRINSYRFN
jgi:hypothetical protein